MIALVDTNVVLDVLLGREPHLAASSAVFAAVETGRCRGLLCATTITTIHYIVERKIGSRASLVRIGELPQPHFEAPSKAAETAALQRRIF